MTEKKANKIATEIKKLLVEMAVDDRLPMDMTQLNEDLFVPIIMGLTKRKEIERMLIDIFDRIGIQTPSNFDEIAEFCYEDVCACADPINWHDGDVSIAFKRWIEKNVEK